MKIMQRPTLAKALRVFPLLALGSLLLGGTHWAVSSETDRRLLASATALQAQLASYGARTKQTARLLSDNPRLAALVGTGNSAALKGHLKDLDLEGFHLLFLDGAGRLVCEYPQNTLDPKTAGKLAVHPTGKLAIMRQGNAVAMLSARPLLVSGMRTGTVVASLLINERLSELKNLLGFETALYLGGKYAGSTFSGPRTVDMDRLPLRKAVAFRHYRTAYFPLLSLNGRNFGALMVAQDIRAQQIGLQLFTVVVLLLGVAAFWASTRRPQPAPVPVREPEPVPMPSTGEDEWSLARATLGVMTKKIAQSSTQLTQKSQATLRFLEGLSRSTYEVARGTSKQARDLGDVRLEIEAIAQGIHRLSDLSGEWFAGIHGIRLVADNGDAAVTKSERALHEAQASAKRAGDSIAALEAVGPQLLEMATYVESFARKSNFLAINTGLEVTRAENRGLAVLLGEIKKLADEAGTASGRVTSLVRQAYQTVPEAASEIFRLIEHLDASTDLIHTGRVAIHRAALTAAEYEDQGRSTATETISLIERGDQAVQTLGRIQQAAVAIAEVAEGMAQALQNKDEGGGAIAGGAAHLSQLTEQLSHFVEKTDV